MRIQKLAFVAGTIAALFAGGCVGGAPGPDTSTRGSLSQNGNGTKAAVGDIYRLQAAFHQAKTFADIDLMMSLWAPDAVFTNITATGATVYDTPDKIRAFWTTSGSFTHSRFSLVPSFKTKIVVDEDNHGYLYFECHDVGNYAMKNQSCSNPAGRFIAGDTFLAGTVARVNNQWVFSNMTAGQAFPLDPNHDYYQQPADPSNGGGDDDSNGDKNAK